MKYLLPFILLTFLISCDSDEPATTSPIDYRPPRIDWIAPESGAELVGTVELCFTVSDDESCVDSARVYINGALYGRWDGHSCLSSITDTTLTLYWNTLDFDDDVYILEARAWDESGNLGISPSLLVKVKNNPDPPPEDRIAPYVWWIAPEAGATLQDTVRLQIGVYDENGVDSVRLMKNGAVFATFPPYASRGGQRGGRFCLSADPPRLTPPLLRKGGNIEAQVVEDTLTFLWNTRSDSDGVYVWEARAWDESGNLGISPSLLVKVKNNPDPPLEDRTPPVVNWLSPEAGTEVSGTEHLRFQVMDESPLDSVIVYLGGRIMEKFLDTGDFLDGDVIWITSEASDGNYTVEVRAWDAFGNMGSSVDVMLTVRNSFPRVLWVPDDYETIQDAVNASEDGDTVRVRDGVYTETVYFWDKNIWLESENGPEHTVIDASDKAWGIYCIGTQDTTAVIRGFTIINSSYLGILIDFQASPKILNNIVINSTQSSLRTSINRSVIRNNIFMNSRQGVELHISNGAFENNIIMNVDRYAIYNVYIYVNPVIPDYNLICNYENLTNDPLIQFGNNNIIDRNPLFLNESFILQDDSPCKDAGHPSLYDPDGSRSDIGAYGGPYAYQISN